MLIDMTRMPRYLIEYYEDRQIQILARQRNNDFN
jgi:hypothetical protein